MMSRGRSPENRRGRGEAFFAFFVRVLWVRVLKLGVSRLVRLTPLRYCTVAAAPGAPGQVLVTP